LQVLQDLPSDWRAESFRIVGSVVPPAALARIFSARHAITEDVRSDSGTVRAASFRTALNTAHSSGGGEWDFAETMTLLHERKLRAKRRPSN
jgi:hypothetical protein